MCINIKLWNFFRENDPPQSMFKSSKQTNKSRKIAPLRITAQIFWNFQRNGAKHLIFQLEFPVFFLFSSSTIKASILQATHLVSWQEGIATLIYDAWCPALSVFCCSVTPGMRWRPSANMAKFQVIYNKSPGFLTNLISQGLNYSLVQTVLFVLFNQSLGRCRFGNCPTVFWLLSIEEVWWYS